MGRIGRILLLAAIVAASLAIRLHDLEADPPGQFAEGSQDFTTDGAYLTMHARSAVLFGSADPLGYQHWESFKYSIISATSWILFKLLGVSLTTTNLAGVALQIAGIILILAAVARELSARFVVIAGLLLGGNFVLWAYSRVPFSENALFPIAGAILLVYINWFDRSWAKVVLGLLVAIGMLFGKLFGALLIVPLFGAVLLFERERWWRGLLLIIGPALVSVLAVSWLLHDERGLSGFLWEHAAGAHGLPHGFESPRAYFESLISFARTGLHQYTPVLSLAAVTSLLLLILRPQVLGWKSRIGSFSVLWIVSWIVCLSPFNYRPLRYMYLLIIPMILLASLVLDRLPALLSHRRREPLAWWQGLLIVLLLWYTGYYLVIHPLITEIDVATYYRIVWYVLPAAVLIGLLIYVLLRGKQIRITERTRNVATVLVVVGILASDGLLYSHWWQQRTYGIRDSGQDLDEVVGPDAVLAGQYGPVLALASGHQSFPLFVSDSVATWGRLLTEYPVTHLAVSAGQWETLTKRFPELARARLLINYWMRDNLVSLVRVAGLFNQGNTNYQLSEFERGIEHLESHRTQEALASFRHVVERNPTHKSALLECYFLLAAEDRLPECRAIVDTLRATYPTDFTVAILGSVYYKWLAGQENSEAHSLLAQSLRDRAIALYPANRAVLENLHATMGPKQLTTLPRSRP